APDAGGGARAPLTQSAGVPGRPGRSPTVPATSPDLSRNRERETSTQVLAYPTGERETSVILLEKRFPTQARLGQGYRYELKVTNLTGWPVTDVVVQEDFPASFAVGDPDAAPASRPAPATVPATDPAPGADDPTAAGGTAAAAAVPAGAPASQPTSAGTETYARYSAAAGYYRDVAGTWWGTAARPERRGVLARKFLVGTLDPKQSKTIPVAGVSDELGKLDTRTTVTYTPVLAGGTDVINPILKLVKEGPRHADLCDPIEYRYAVSNVGVGTETDVRIDDPLPDGLTTDDGKRAVAIAVGDLPQNERREFRVRVKAARTGEYAGAAGARGFGTAAKSAEVRTAVHAPVLAVAMTGPDADYVGKLPTYEVTVTNTGDAAARNATVAAAADNGAEVGFPPADPPPGGGVVAGMPPAAPPPAVVGSTLSVGAIEPGQSRKIRVTARPLVGGQMTVRATAKADCAAPAAATAKTAVRTIAALAMDVADRDDPVRVGEATVYRITVRNQGTGPDRNVKVVASLPPQLAFVAAGGPTVGTADGAKVTFAPLAQLDPGQAMTWTVEVKAAEAGDVRFRVDLTSESLTDPVVGTQPTRVY
ncbi:MAG: omcB, partial [Phycisphaerales bacterium]|nr:omcB [Phycisphaerales bacterium]